QWQSDLSLSLDRIGGVLVATDRNAEALEAYRKGLAIAERLAAADRGNAAWQRDRVVSEIKVGDVLARMGRREEALASYRQGLASAQRAGLVSPGTNPGQRELWVFFRESAGS